AIEGLERVLVIALTSRTLMPTFVSSGQIYSHMLVVFSTADAADLALRSSAQQYWWAVTHGSSMKGDPRYTPTDCAEPMARPQPTHRMREVGERLFAYRSGLMLDRGEGLTRTYNRMHKQEER